MDVSYSRDAFNTYMVIDGSMEQGVEDTEKMLANQHSFALLPFHEQQLNEQKKYYYDISGRIELKGYIEHQPAGGQMVRQLIMFILELHRTMEEYLLDPDGILLKAEYVYMDMAEKTLAAACIPGRKEDFNTQLKELASWLLENADHTDREGVLLVYDFYKMVQRADFLPGHLRKFEEKKEEVKFVQQMLPEEELFLQKEDDVSTDKEEQIHKEENYTEKKESEKWGIAAAAGGLVLTAGLYKTGLLRNLLLYIGLDAAEEYMAGALAVLFVIGGVIYYVRKVRIKVKVNKVDGSDKGAVYSFTDQTAENSYFAEEKTVILSGTEGSVRLISMNKHVTPDLILSEFPCTVGCSKEKNQYCVSVEGISRQHAIFEKQSDGIYLMDLHSTNGTKVNGEFLEANEKRRLIAEDIVELAGVRFMYCQ